MEEIYKNVSINNLENEEWRDVVGYEGLYQISSFGRVKSLGNNAARKEKILCQRKNNKGYLIIGLWKEGKMKHFLVHRLVAQAFIPNPNNFPMINHKDENKTNNCVENLEWCDAKYNCNYGTCQKRRVENIDYKARTSNTDYKAIAEKRVANTDWKAKVANTDYKAFQAKRVASTDWKAIAEKLTNGVLSKKVYQYTRDGKLVKIWFSTRECGRNGFDQGHVAACCRGKLKTHKGFIWSYVPLENI